MQLEMGRCLIFWWGLRLTRWQRTWMEGIYWCRVVSTTMWVKISYKNLILQACRIIGWLVRHCLFGEVVPWVAQMYEPILVCMFDKFHLMFNFKSKVSRDVLSNKKWMSIDIYIFFISKMPSQCHMLASTCHFNF